MIQQISCLITDVIKLTLASCDWRDCDEVCHDYLMAVADHCPVVFHNEVYLELWNALFKICSPQVAAPHFSS